MLPLPNVCNNDRATIHEAMEQQTLSIAKAGLVVSYRCESITKMNESHMNYVVR